MRGALYIATFETRHFDFEGVGTSKAEAIDVLKQGLRTHAKQCDLALAWFEPLDANVTRYERGMALRDHQELPL